MDVIGIRDYQEKASRTMNTQRELKAQISNYCMGLSGETGEVVDELKKVLYHGHELDLESLKKELGDIMWYLAAISTILKIDLNEVALLNIEKLEKRYPRGFSCQDSLDRKE